jgi:hypothetical protein
MAHARSDVQSRGNVRRRLRCRGWSLHRRMGRSICFMIVRLDLEAEMSWLVSPKKDLRVHLKVSVVAS